MFGLFKSTVINDEILGPFSRRGGDWIGTIDLADFSAVELRLEGDRKAPFPETLRAAYALPDRLTSLVPKIAAALLEHLEPYQDAMQDPVEQQFFLKHIPDPAERKQIAEIATAEQAWAASSISGVEIGRENGKVRLLLKIGTPWDVEHTLGAFLDDWKFMELNGSV